jgi:glycosyltransferase involved in cell wall biosynthesis
VARAQGGLYYRSSLEFQEVLEYLVSHPVERVAMGRQGQSYVEREYRWPTVIERVEAVLRKVQARANSSD